MRRMMLATLLAMMVVALPLAAQTGAAAFKCPPCGQDCDQLEFEAAGTCPHCNMALVPAGEGSRPPRCAILIFDGVQIIDYTGPYEVFGQAQFEVYTVAAVADTIVTAMGMRVVPNYTIENAPAADVVVVPGGHVHDIVNIPGAMDWLRAQSAGADQVLSVCNGAFILAAAGLLDGLRATTFYGLLDEFERTATKTTVVRDERFVDNGKFITSAGLSSGIDASLHVLEKRLGRARAQRIAIHLEYDWNPDPQAGFARGALALVHLEGMPDMLEGLESSLVTTSGDRDRWRMEREVMTDLAPAALQTRMAEVLAKDARWKRTSKAARTVESRWVMTDRNGGHWNGTLAVAPSHAGALRATLEIERAEGAVSKR